MVKSLKSFLITEADTKAAFEMETSIVNAANGDKHTSSLVKEKAAKNIIKFLNSKGVKGKGQMPASIYPTNFAKWDKYFPNSKVPGSTKTPKTDIIIGNTKISLKTGPAQLTSGGKNEASALFYNAIERAGKKPNDLISSIRDNISQLAPSTVTSEKGNVAQVLKSEKDKILVKANKLNQKLKQQIRELFSTGGAVSTYFTEEAMSGSIKFNNNLATATHILVTNFEGNNNSLHRTNDLKYVSKIASQVNPQVRFKSTSVKSDGVKTGYYRYWGVVSLITEEIEHDTNLLIEELNRENLLQEGIFDTITQKGKEVYDRITNFLKNIKEKIINLFNKAIEYIKEGWKNVLEFFDLDLDVDHGNYVSW